MSEKHQCEGRVAYGDWGRSKPCSNTGSLEHEGKHFCKLHHPPTVKAKRQAKHAEWKKQCAERDAAAAKAKADLAEQKRRAECFPDLLSAARAVAFSNGFDVAFPDKLEALRAAIAKAEQS